LRAGPPVIVPAAPGMAAPSAPPGPAQTVVLPFMKTEFIDVSPTRKQLVFEIATDRVDTAIDRVTRTVGQVARIPGFRPGKAPARLVKQRYKDQILSEVMQDLIPKAIDEELKARAIEPVSTPDVRDVSLEEGQPLTFTADFETVPPIDAVDYTTLTLRRSPVEVADEAVASMLERLRDRNARFEPADDRPSERGDVLTVDMARREVGAAGDTTATAAGATESLKEVTVEIGAPTNPPGFDDALAGLAVGSTTTFPVRFPADYRVAELAGRDLEYTVAVRGIKKKVRPDLDDEFARDLGEDSLDAVRARVRDGLQRDAERTQAREMRIDLLQQLAERVPFDAPETLVAHEVDRRTEELVRQLVDQGVNPHEASIDWDAFRDHQRDTSRSVVKSLLVLDDIARREGITVSESDVSAEVARLAERTGTSAAAVRARLDQEGGLARMATLIRRDKTVEWLLSRVTIVIV
jgi:trigger factor